MREETYCRLLPNSLPPLAFNKFLRVFDQCDRHVISVDNFWTDLLFLQVFFVVWWLSTFWFTAWVLNKGRVHNWFRMPCDLSQATVVNVWAQVQSEVLSVNVFVLVRVLQRIKVCLFPFLLYLHHMNPVWCILMKYRFYMFHGTLCKLIHIHLLCDWC